MSSDQENETIETTQNETVINTTKISKKKPVLIKKKLRRFKRKTSYSGYIFKVLKQVHPSVSISSRSMSIMNSFVEDLFDQIGQEAAKLATLNGKGKTISNREIQSAVKLILPGELAKHAISEGTKALTKFEQSKN